MTGLRSRRRKGITGIEAAIVMIAFVVVAAALAFVVLNMGMFTTQRARQVIAQGLQESSSSLMVDGSVTAYINNSHAELISIPIRLAGQEPVDLAKGKTTVAVIAGKLAYDNWYQQCIYSFTSDSKIHFVDPYNSNITYDADPYDLSDMAYALNYTQQKPGVYIVFLPKTIRNDNSVLEPGEKALVLVFFNASSAAPGAYDHIRIEIRPPEGAPLTVDRYMPAVLPEDEAITLG